MTATKPLSDTSLAFLTIWAQHPDLIITARIRTGYQDQLRSITDLSLTKKTGEETYKGYHYEASSIDPHFLLPRGRSHYSRNSLNLGALQSSLRALVVRGLVRMVKNDGGDHWRDTRFFLTPSGVEMVMRGGGGDVIGLQAKAEAEAAKKARMASTFAAKSETLFKQIRQIQTDRLRAERVVNGAMVRVMTGEVDGDAELVKASKGYVQTTLAGRAKAKELVGRMRQIWKEVYGRLPSPQKLEDWEQLA